MQSSHCAGHRRHDNRSDLLEPVIGYAYTGVHIYVYVGTWTLYWRMYMAFHWSTSCSCIGIFFLFFFLTCIAIKIGQIRWIASSLKYLLPCRPNMDWMIDKCKHSTKISSKNNVHKTYIHCSCSKWKLKKNSRKRLLKCSTFDYHCIIMFFDETLAVSLCLWFVHFLDSTFFLLKCIMFFFSSCYLLTHNENFFSFQV